MTTYSLDINNVCNQDPGKGAVTSTRDWARHAFECLSVPCKGVGHPWPAAGTGSLAAADLGGPHVEYALPEEVTISPTGQPPARWLTNWRTIIPKKSSHCCGSSRPHNRFPNLGIRQRDWEPPREFYFEGQWDLITELPQDWETETPGGHKQNLVCTRTQEKAALTPQETWARLASECSGVSGEAWTGSGPLQRQGHWLQRSWDVWRPGLSPFGGGHQYAKLQAGNTAPAISRKLELRFTENGLAH